MAGWNDLPRGRLLADVSLWSADLADLKREVAAVSALADSFHFDVADAHFAPTLLFFPDLVRAVRPLTPVPFHVHLMVASPGLLVEEFVAAGADLVTVHVEIAEAEIHHAFRRVRAAGRCCGIALQLETPVETVTPFLDRIDAVLLLGTEMGVKGQNLGIAAGDRLARLRRLLLDMGRPSVRIIADGAVRAHTVPLLRASGADVVVPGSMVFASNDPAGVLRWLRSVGPGAVMESVPNPGATNDRDP